MKLLHKRFPCLSAYAVASNNSNSNPRPDPVPENKPDPVPENQPGPVIDGFVEVIENHGILSSEIQASDHPSCGYNTSSQLSSGPVSIQPDRPLCLLHVQSDIGTTALSTISESSQEEIEKVAMDETCPQPNPPIWVPQC